LRYDSLARSEVSKRMADTLSSYIMRCIERFDEPGEDEDLSREQAEEVRGIVDIVTRALLESRLASTDQKAVLATEAMLAGNRELVTGMFDDYYTRALVKSVPKYVRRTVKLASLVVQKVPSSEVRLYFREAGKNYVFGHWCSSIALSRVALETSLRECIEARGVTPERELKGLIDAADKLGLLDGPHRHLAAQVQRCGNDIIHATPQKQPKAQGAFDTLVALRGVLLHLYKVAEA
jgi:hypothetical protein